MGRRPEPTDLIAAAIGFGVIFVLVSTASAFSYFQSSRAQREARALVTESEHTADLVGRIGRVVSRIHADTLEALTEPADTAKEIAGNVAVLNAELDQLMGQLEPRLDEAQLIEWERLRPNIASVRADFAEAFEGIGDERRDEAERVLDRDAVMVAWVFDQLERLSTLARHDARQAVLKMDDRIATAGRLQLLAFAVLLLCTGLVGTAVVRELRRQRKSLKDYVDRIENSNDDLEAFAGRVAHDLKNLLTPVMVAPRQLARAGGDAAAVSRISERMERSSRRAIELLESLLAFAKAGQPAGPETAPVGLEVQQVLEELAPLADQMQASIEVDIKGTVVAACAPALLHVVLLNLVSNSLKFLDGRPRRWVGVSAQLLQGACVIDVADSGPGIPREYRTQVFDPFFRAPGTHAPGSGIGLATVQRIVNGHRGAIILESIEGEGTRVRVQLPAVVSVTAKAEPASNGAESASAHVTH
jgi:signal transduction histidine kinase